MNLRLRIGRPKISSTLILGLILGLIPVAIPTPAYAAACSPSSTSTVDIYTVLTFTSTTTCDWTVPTGVTSIDLFMVGGGGGGGGDGGGGGGGGAAISRTAFAVTTGSSLALTVGTGGAGSVWSTGYAGDNGTASTLVRTSPSTTLTANGGTKGGLYPSGVAGAGGTAVNGGFAGGRGGSPSGASNSKGGDGYTGISNYFSGSKIEYGGGGGGGSYYGASSFTETLGKSGGGNGGASGSGNNQPGNPGRANSGGGGGGGSANSPQQAGGRGADGVILIRFATSSVDAFPSSLISSLVGRFTPNDLQVLDNSRKAWIDSSGSQAASTSLTSTSSTSMSITTRGSTDGANSTGSSKTILVAKGGTGDRATLLDLPTNYTAFHVTRYVTGGSLGRIMSTSSSSSNWLSGHHGGTYKCAHHNQWLTGSGCSSSGIYRWLLSTDQLRYYRADGADVTLNPDNSTYLSGQSMSTGFGVNNHVGGQYSDWEFADLIVFNKRLSAADIFTMETYLARVYGLSITTKAADSETDTAVNLNGSPYFYGYYQNDFTFDDLFTMETWVKPTSTCASGGCSLFSAENTLVTKIQNGEFQYALYTSSSSWEWIGTGVSIPSNEWSHIAISKVLPGNQTNAIKVYLNGQLAYTKSGSPYRLTSASGSVSDTVAPISSWYYIGARTYGERFYGLIDEFKYWSSARSESDITSDMHSNSVTDSNLKLYYDFNSTSSTSSDNLLNLATNGGGRTHMKASTTMTYSDVKTLSSSGPYSIATFPRSYITQEGGWKPSIGTKSASAIIVAGGGGGGAESDDTGWFGGGGGAGGYQLTNVSIQASDVLTVSVGVGGRGGQQVSWNPDASTLPVNGGNSQLGSFTSIGGGAGGVSYTSGRISGSTGGSGGGGATYSGAGGSGTAGQGNSGGAAASGCCAGGGGGGAGSAGGNGSAPSTATSVGGSAGNGVLNSMYIATVSPQYLAAGGAAGSYTNSGSAGSQGGTAAWQRASANSGSGGGGGGSSPTNRDKAGGAGGSGIIIVRWITASVPSYTKPTNANINVGMTETFTVNVTADSATVGLTRTFKWESSTAGSGGPWRIIKEGTGASNASFSWVPTDTSTSGSNFLYRLTVTDSDTAGLYITDSSTAYAVINLALGLSGSSSIKKTINSSKIETYTVTEGTPSYRYTLSPTTTGITLDTTTAGYPRILLSETLTVGTYLETLTVTDSVSATYSLPLTISVSGPPSLTAAGEIVKDGQVLNLDAGNSQSILLADSATAISTAWNDISGNKKHASTSTTVNSTSCNAPTYSADYGGILTFRSSGSTCYATPYLGTQFIRSYSVETWFRLNSATLPSGYQILSQQYTTSGENISFAIGDLTVGDGKIRVGYFDGSAWRYAATGYTPTRNSWVHIIGTYDGTNVKTYINGSLYSSTGWTGGGGSSNLKGILIGKRWDGAYYIDGSFGEVRVYNRAITSSEVSQNYSATKVRYQDANINLSRISQKHNTSTTDSFTVTSGGETRTVTYSVGNRSGVTWSNPDTSTVQIQVGPELLVGTFYDTITVTDNFSSSTILPVKITISKGDQAKLSIGQYNAFVGTSTYPINVYGGSGTGSVTRSLTDSGTAGCTLASSMFLTAARVGSCTVQAVKATDTNWLAETATATIYWIQWSDAYATQVPSTPTEIVLSHSTAITKYNYETLTVTSYQNSSGTTITSIATGAALRIIGDGFDPSAAYTEVVFASMDAVDLTSGLQVVSNGAGGYYLQLTVPSGVSTGAITVNSPKGTARGAVLTIVP